MRYCQHIFLIVLTMLSMTHFNAKSGIKTGIKMGMAYFSATPLGCEIVIIPPFGDPNTCGQNHIWYGF